MKVVHTLRPARANSFGLALALLICGGCQKPVAGPGRTDSSSAPASEGPAIVWIALNGTVEVQNLSQNVAEQLRSLTPDSANWPAVFAVTVENGDGTPVLGQYAIERHDQGTYALRFVPRFSLVPGVSYRAVFDPSRLPDGMGVRISSDFAVASQPLPPPAEVAQVYPSADRLPENLLRFYIHFSAPMRRGEVYDHVRLINSRGDVIVHPFLEIGEELWDADGKRLTLFIDPGRIKRGLKPREDLGPVLEAGQSYTLLIDAAWRDAHGQPLAKEHRKSFRAEAPIERGLEPSDWTIAAVRSGSNEPLIVRFPRPLDHALLHRTLTIVGHDGRPITGSIAVADNETLWKFTPVSAWSAGRYELVIDPILEDITGNRIGRPFEVDDAGASRDRDAPLVRRAFDIR